MNTLRRIAMPCAALLALLASGNSLARQPTLRPTAIYRDAPLTTVAPAPTITLPPLSSGTTPAIAAMRVRQPRARRPSARASSGAGKAAATTKVRSANTRPQKASRGQLTAARNAQSREVAERDARSMRIYRTSQLSAPIIPDATSCKRVGAHGESIYENCGMDLGAR
ncbi:MAG: hypothetical protein ABIQ97_06735 [Lysobacteraceae bacterium]